MKQFEWDSEKAIRNERVHNVSFVEAASVFADFFALTIFDKGLSHDEDHYIDLGLSSNGRLLIFIHSGS